MNDPRLPRLVYLALLLMGILQWMRVYPLLPERMASHFAYNGAPNGWQTKGDFFTTMFLVVAISTAVAFLLPLLMAILPDALINLPNKQYWLAPERRADTHRFLGAQMGWFGCGLLFLLLYATWQAIQVNLPHSKHFDSQGMMQVLIGFMVFAAILVIVMVRHFYIVPDDPHSSNSKPNDRPHTLA